MKKILIALLAAAMLFAFVACDNDETASTIIKDKKAQNELVTELTTFMKDFQTNRSKYTEEGSDEIKYVTDADLTKVGIPTSFVEIATVNEKPSSIEVFGKTVSSGDKALVDINKNVFLRDEAFKVDNSKLYVNAFYLFYAYASESTVKVGEETAYTFTSDELSELDSFVQWASDADAKNMVKLTSAEAWKTGSDAELKGREFDVVVAEKNKPMYSWYDGQVNTDLILSYVEYKYPDGEKADSWKLAFLGAGAAGMNQANVNYFYGWDNKNPTDLANAVSMTVISNGVVCDADGPAKKFSQTFHVSPYSAADAT